MNLLILSTLPHFIPLYLIVNDKIYFSIVLLSSSFSITWHYCCEPTNFIFFIDYLLGILWTTYEILIVMKYMNELLSYVVIMNIFVLLTNLTMDKISRKNILKYKYAHSIFHIISSLKTTFVAYMISKKLY